MPMLIVCSSDEISNEQQKEFVKKVTDIFVMKLALEPEKVRIYFCVVHIKEKVVMSFFSRGNMMNLSIKTAIEKLTFELLSINDLECYFLPKDENTWIGFRNIDIDNT